MKQTEKATHPVLDADESVEDYGTMSTLYVE